MKYKKKNGFTLIELIVTMTIVMILTIVGLVSYTGSMKKARDSRRVSDVEKIRLALEMYRQAVGSSYPANLNTLMTTYIQSIPVGPKGDSYDYVRGATNYTYTLDAHVEDVGSTNMAGMIYRVVSP